MGAEMLEERSLAVGALPEQEGATEESPSILAETGHEPVARLEVEGATAPSLAEDIARVSDLAGSSSTGAGPQVPTSVRPAPSSTLGYFSDGGTRKLPWSLETSLQDWRSSRCFP